MSAVDNRSGQLLEDALDKLKNDTTLTDLLPDGSGNIHPAPRDDDREADVSLNVGFAGGSAVGMGRTTLGERLLRVQLEVSPDYFETKGTYWMYDVLDQVESVLEGVGGGGRAPDGRGAGIEPTYDDQQDRYIADATHRYATVHS